MVVHARTFLSDQPTNLFNTIFHHPKPPSQHLQALALWADFKTSGLLADRILYLSLMNALNHNRQHHHGANHHHHHSSAPTQQTGGKEGGGAAGGKSSERQTVFDLLDEAADAGIPLDTQVRVCVYACGCGWVGGCLDVGV